MRQQICTQGERLDQRGSVLVDPTRFRWLFRRCPCWARRFGWHFAGADGDLKLWVYKCGKPYARRDWETMDQFQLLRECIKAFADSIQQVNDPDRRGSGPPVLALDQIQICERIWIMSENRPDTMKRGAVRRRRIPPNRRETTMYLTREGLESVGTLFDEAAHAHERMTRASSEPQRYQCHQLIGSAFVKSAVFSLLPPAEQRRVRDNLAEWAFTCRRNNYNPSCSCSGSS